MASKGVEHSKNDGTRRYGNPPSPSLEAVRDALRCTPRALPGRLGRFGAEASRQTVADLVQEVARVSGRDRPMPREAHDAVSLGLPCRARKRPGVDLGSVSSLAVPFRSSCPERDERCERVFM